MDALASKLGRDFSQEGERFESRDEISALFSDYISKHNYKEIEARFNDNGVCWSKYQTVKEMVDHDPDCSLDNPMFSQIEQPGIGSFRAAGAPWSFSAFERQPAKPAPKLGEQTDEVLAEVVGLSSAEIGRLHDAGIVAGPEK
jgi:2-methylfumaryl-CoA isomerase